MHVAASLVIGYLAYRKSHKGIINEDNLNLMQVGIGALLILIDVSYNLIRGDDFRSFDYGMLLAGSTIILLNTGILGFLKLERKMITFSTYFIFIVMLLYGFFFKGIELIIGG